MRVLIPWCLILAAASPTLAKEIPFQLESFDGTAIDAKLALPDGVPEAKVERVVILVHGSGAHSMDKDLSMVTVGGKKNLYFKDMSDGLVAKGWAVIRYNKRNWQMWQKVKKEPGFQKSAAFKKYTETPYLKGLVGDAKSFARWARKRLPRAKVCLLGVSEGTHTVLWAANEMPKEITGVALVGFYLLPLSTVTFEQVIHRPLVWFRKQDKNHDERLSMEELKGTGPKGFNLMMQVSAIDSDGDEQIGVEELKAASACAIYVLKKGTVPYVYTRMELDYPRIGQVLERSSFKVAFFQGVWDNQTPAYNAQAVRIANEQVWKKPNLKFRFFPKLGHGLDPRDSYEDIVYRPIDRKALAAMGEDMTAFFK